MSKPLDEKLQLYIMNLASTWLPFGGVNWDSSAKKLSDDLELRGIKLKNKIFWNYKLPNDMSPQKFQNKIAIEYFCKNFYTNFAKHILRDKNLTVFDKVQIMRYVWEMRKNKNHQDMNFYADEIRRKNPELADIKPTNSIANLVYGALFGFAPAEIKYFCEVSRLRDFDREHELDAKLESLGIHTSYVLAPDTANAIMKVLQQQKE